MPHVDRNAPDVTQPVTAQPVSQDSRAELRRLHSKTTIYFVDDPTGCCAACLSDDVYMHSCEIAESQRYPCPTIRLLDALEAAERREDALVEALRFLYTEQIVNITSPAKWADLFGVIDAGLSGDMLADVFDDRPWWHNLHTALHDVAAAHDARRRGADHE